MDLQSRDKSIKVIGGGLAGSEAAWQIAQRGIPVCLYEMRPSVTTGAHTGGNFAELVCSNSLGSNLPDRASGLLKEEMRRMNSLLLNVAEQTAVPAGSALAVDREAFSLKVTQAIQQHPLIQVIREEVHQIPEGLAVVATGPLTSPGLVKAIQEITSEDQLYFYDAIAPIVQADSINFDIAFQASRYDKGSAGGDYINCPFSRQEYEAFQAELVQAERIPLREFELDINQGVLSGAGRFFEGCLPVEVLAHRGPLSLAYGPLRPVGLADPHTGRRPYAVLQLRKDNLAGSLYNMVGFQTNLTYPEQKRVFRMIPGLEKAEFVRLGQMHRNTFIASPKLLQTSLQMRARPSLLFAGQICGVEGYMGNIATGLLAGLNAARLWARQDCLQLPGTTMLGALCEYICNASLDDFQPMKANFGILPPLENVFHLGKRERYAAYSARSLQDLDHYLDSWRAA